MSFWEDIFGPQRVNNRHQKLPIPNNPYINTIIVSSIHVERSVTSNRPDLKTYSVPPEMKEKIKDQLIFVESLFLKECGEKLTIRPVWGPVTTAKPEDAVIDVTKVNDYTDQMREIFNKNKKYFSEIELVIVYGIGSSFPDGSEGFAFSRKFEEEPYYQYFILMSEGGSQEILAHEVGHILNYSHKDGKKDDPDPIERDEGHNKNKDNLMFPTVTGTDITEQQAKQFFESKIIQRP